jgi:hypothetical protein
MRRLASLFLFAGFLIPLLSSAPAHAQATRTWISGVGDDVNPCSRTAPCKTFAGAISKTQAFGEINCLDPGGFGGVTITKSITLNCHEIMGSILVAGTNGVTINAGVNDKVVLRNIQLQGLLGTASPGLAGVKIIQAAVVSIEDCVITQFSQQGIVDNRTGGGTKLMVKDTVVSMNGGAGVTVAAGATNNAVIDNVRAFSNAFGVAVGNGNNATIKRSVLSGNTTAGVEADAGGQVTVDDSAITNNVTGVQAGGTIRVSNSDINFNTTAFSGSVVTYGNNRVFGNGTVGATTAAGVAAPALGQQ